MAWAPSAAVAATAAAESVLGRISGITLGAPWRPPVRRCFWPRAVHHNCSACDLTDLMKHPCAWYRGAAPYAVCSARRCLDGRPRSPSLNVNFLLQRIVRIGGLRHVFACDTAASPAPHPYGRSDVNCAVLRRRDLLRHRHSIITAWTHRRASTTSLISPTMPAVITIPRPATAGVHNPPPEG